MVSKRTLSARAGLRHMRGITLISMLLCPAGSIAETGALLGAPLNFEANQGQTDSQVKFLSRGDGYSLFLTSDEAVFMLRTPAGATIAALMTATEWQRHSVRGFLAGVVRKKLGLHLVSESTDKGRVYRIKDSKARSGAGDRVKQAA